MCRRVRTPNLARARPPAHSSRFLGLLASPHLSGLISRRVLARRGAAALAGSVVRALVRAQVAAPALGGAPKRMDGGAGVKQDVAYTPREISMHIDNPYPPKSQKRRRNAPKYSE